MEHYVKKDMLHSFVLILLMFLTVVSSETLVKNETVVSTPFVSCTGAARKDPIELRIKGCPELPCKFPQRTHQELEVDFEVVDDTDTLEPIVMANTMGLEVRFPVPEPDGCKTLTNAECPLDKGEEITYKLALEISENYPPVALTMELTLKDAKGRSLVCFSISANVVIG